MDLDAETVAVPAGTDPSPANLGRGSIEGLDAPLLREGDRVERYVITGLIGAGGMGVVYSAYDPQLRRDVALKMIKPRPDASDPQRDERRLVAEARAMAQLNHPNVIAIYDVRRWKDHVVLAMELLQGEPLSWWLRDDTRSWREIVDVFVLAGRGLSAAHEAGIVHRDFKPSNVLVDDYDATAPKVHVLDFGLARALRSTQPLDDDPTSVSGGSVTPDPHGDDTRLTQTGFAVGTPKYMSPEQACGGPVDARSDQFSFCVALWWALYGQPPFSPDDKGYRRLREPSSHRDVPAHVRRVLRRGLHVRADARFDSMDQLLARLRQDPGRRRRRILSLGLGGLTVMAAGAIGWVSGQQDHRCDGADERWATVWSPAMQERTARAFAQRDEAYAQQSHARVEERLDAFGTAWVQAHTSTCEQLADHEPGLLDLRMACLERARVEVEALVQLLGDADDRAIENAPSAVANLPSPQACTRIEAKGSDPFAHEPSPDLTEARRALAQVEALLSAGHYEEALAQANTLETRARTLDHPGLLAEVLFASGRASFRVERHDESVARLEEAELVARSSGHDRLVVRIAAELAYILGHELGRPDDALEWGRHGLAASARVPDAVGARGLLLMHIGTAKQGKARYDEAMEHYEQARELLTQAYGTDSTHVARAWNNIANAHSLLAEVQRAEEAYRKSFAIWSAVVGDEHPDAVIPLANLARALMRKGQLIEGKEMEEKVLRVWTRAYGPEHSRLTIPLGTLAEVSRNLEQWDEAIDHDTRAVKIYEQTFGTDHPNVAYPLYGLGMTHYMRGDLERAHPFFLRTLAIRESAFGPDDPRLCLTLCKLALVRVGLGDAEEALAYAQRALEIGKAAHGDDNPNVARLEYTLAAVLLELHRYEEAVAPLQRTIDLRPPPTKYHPDEVGGPRFDLARAYHALGRDPDELRELAEDAAGRYAAWGDDERAAQIRTWIAQNLGPT